MLQHCPVSSSTKGNPNTTNLVLTTGAASAMVPIYVPFVQPMLLLQDPLVAQLLWIRP
ncbi:hypothetical protein DSO57_1013651 [Entomophthora muscae]|uniref:Uncharacterized protein n=1 Tax=Entomophthora muscae TaxID=34485 RepID=A0ACC2T5K5_9FUNG|nr:hypothetical protein DSO57_1013651 [Entomophthora muscae]